MGIYILSILFWPILIIGAIIFFISRRRRRHGHSRFNAKNLDFSKEEVIAQTFFVLTVMLLGTTLLAINRTIGSLFEWQTILFITIAITFFVAYKYKMVFTLTFAIIGLYTWLGVQFLEWGEIDSKTDIRTIGLFVAYMLISLLFYTIGSLHTLHHKYKRFALVYTIFGLIAVTGMLFYLSTKGGIGGLSRMLDGTSIFGSWQIVLVLFMLIITLLVSIGYTFTKQKAFLYELIFILLMTILFIGFLFLPDTPFFNEIQPGRRYYDGTLNTTGVVMAIFFNALVFGQMVGLLLLGMIKREIWMINLGALFIFILLLTKYFDWFFTFLDKSIFFIGAGILMFGLGWGMEKSRRAIISSAHNESTGEQQS